MSCKLVMNSAKEFSRMSIADLMPKYKASVFLFARNIKYQKHSNKTVINYCVIGWKFFTIHTCSLLFIHSYNLGFSLATMRKKMFCHEFVIISNVGIQYLWVFLIKQSFSKSALFLTYMMIFLPFHLSPS